MFLFTTNTQTPDLKLAQQLKKKRAGLTDTNLLLIITITVFIVMYVSAVIFLGRGFTKPQTFLNILNENA